jgi:hypothetical protein
MLGAIFILVVTVTVVILKYRLFKKQALYRKELDALIS